MIDKSNAKESKSAPTAAGLLGWAGLLAILAGILYIVIQFIHPSEQISSVDSASWVIVACLTVAMSLFSLIGVTAIYARQARESGWLGLAGFLLFSLFWLASIAFSFVEAFVLPLLTTEAPKFVEGFLGIFGGAESEVPLGVLPALAPIAGALYLLGGLLLGIATFRAGVLPRMAAVLLAFGAVATLAGAVIPHPLDRILAAPMGLAFIWLGYALWAGRGRRIG
ncbi:hypothetical protein [Cohnella hongkongensis]|uniref:DUF4386 family protein n=1 Tax=Cohnella hongkongensis TaxID=178337 RepID=A0ABV9FCP9_9BACL